MEVILIGAIMKYHRETSEVHSLQNYPEIVVVKLRVFLIVGNCLQLCCSLILVAA